MKVFATNSFSADLALKQLPQHTTTADCMMHAAAYAKAHTVLGSCFDSTAVHVCQCTSTGVQCKLLPQTVTLLYSNCHSCLQLLTAGCMLQHMPKLTKCWEAVRLLQLRMYANAAALQCNENYCHKNFSADLVLKQLPQLSATADGMMLQHMPRPTQCWEAVLILQLYMCANAPAL